MSTYGSFNKNDEFEINSPFTPEPWLHYLIRPNQKGTETFCSGVSYTGGGFDVRGTHENTFIDTQLHLNDADDNGRYVYIVDEDTKDHFTTTWQPVRNPNQNFKTTLGFGKICFESECNKLTTKQVMFVPKEFDGWIQNITLTNNSDKKRNLSIYPFVPIHMGDALIRLMAGDNDGFFGGASFDDTLNSIIFRRNHGTAVDDNPEKINGMLGNIAAFYCTLNNEESQFDTSMERFLGDRFHSLSNPKALEEGTLSNKNQSYLRRTCGVFKNSVTIEPGETIEFAVALVASSTEDYYLNGKVELKKILIGLQEKANRESMLKQVEDAWNSHMSSLQISTPDVKLNRAFKWLQYQCQIVYVLNRMKSRYHTGYEYGWGFRDILQDVVFNLPYNSQTVKDALKHISTQMFSNGVCYHNFFIDQPGNKDIEASDDPIWLPSAIIKYCKETGDYGFLDETTAYAEVHEGTADIHGTILEHCLKAVDRVWSDRSERGLPYMKDCDWNDDLNELRINNEPNRNMESVMVAQQLYRVLLDVAELCEVSKRSSDIASIYRQRAEELKKAIYTYAVDKEGYFKRALSLSDSIPDLGSSENECAKIFLESQVFSILSGVADEEKTKTVLSKIEQYLDTEFGAQICYPVYTDLAERNILPKQTWNIEKEPPAMKENGSIFMHLNAWLVQAYAIAGSGEKAVDFYTKCLPENLASDQDRYKSEPYIYPEYVRGRGGEEFGRGGHTWLTGTAPTMHQALVDNIFGIRAHYDGLEVDPKVSKEWKEFSITRQFRGATYSISFKNPHGVESGITSITVNGENIEGNIITPRNVGEAHSVVVTMG